ncbi:MAG: hypothetical protein ABSB15_24060 [Bryobacteraceae bacterium]|jgi:hypothetical protein
MRRIALLFALSVSCFSLLSAGTTVVHPKNTHVKKSKGKGRKAKKHSSKSKVIRRSN